MPGMSANYAHAHEKGTRLYSPKFLGTMLESTHHILKLFFPHSLAPSASPRNVTASAESATTICVSWIEVSKEHHNGKITGYIIEYTNVNHSESVNVTANSAEGVLRDLHEFEEYTVRVAAQTVAGIGPFSDNASVMTLTASKFIVFLIE